jgi:signal transduction histidine kinase
MAESLPLARRRWQLGARSVLRLGRRTVVESLYLLTGPFTAAAGLLLVPAALCLGAASLLLPGGSRAVSGLLAPARWCANVERWRIATVRSVAAGARGAGGRPRPQEISASDPGLWLDVAHALVALPLALVTAVLTLMWWWIGLWFVSYALRNDITPGSLHPYRLSTGGAQSHIAISLGLTSPGERIAFITGLGVLALLTLPLVTRACSAAQTGLGQALLWDASALHRRISGLEQERDTARAQTVAAVTAEAAALRRLERDIHDGPQQHLVRLALELGRAQRHFDTRPQAAREALADAIGQAQDALEELRALSRGIAPPILADRGLREALTALAARSTVPADLDAGPLEGPLAAVTETTAYFTVAEALTNVAKHSQARRCTIGLRHDEGTLRVWVTDDGTGGAALGKGHGLSGLDDRLHAAGGQLRVSSPDGGPTTITAELPCC